MSKRLLILLLFISIYAYNVKTAEAFYPESTFFAQNDNYFLHTIERGQTVYSIAAMYHVSVEDIYKLNPGSKEVIRAGDVLKIPQESGSFIYHTIQPKETLYGVSQKYGMKGEDIIAVNSGLSVETFNIGKIIRIPTNRVTSPLQGGNEVENSNKTNSLLSKTGPVEAVNTIKIALLLPFSETNSQNVARMVEYYEGFLLALQEIKKQGISVDLQVYDIGTGTKEINNILKKDKMQHIHLLIGGLSDEQIKLISRFSIEKNIPYVIPFTSKSDEPFNNPNVYQVNTPQPHLYSKASLAFINKYKNDNIILVTQDVPAPNQLDFIKVLKEDLQDKKISYKTVNLDINFLSDLNTQLSKDKKNVIIPMDDSAETLARLITPLKWMLESHPDLKVSLFGYLNWQSHIAKFADSSEDFFLLNTSFYTVFYANPTYPDVKSFYNNFYKWYSRNLLNYFPKYGILGYDTGLYFIRLIHNYGTLFDSHVNDLRDNGIQIDFQFQRVNNWGGFINTNLYIVDYNSDHTITKSIIR
ncbi:peptidase M23 [Bacteroidia bacterium]|nr:peptidase M23 [Bacteroidia bacterium]GHT27021.1 peptidase M23 [Bacteroidia bacterium]